MNDLVNALKYWHKIEHFAPYEPNEINSENFRRIRILDDSCLPWNQKKEYERIYTVYLGIFRMKETIEAIETVMGRDKTRFEDSPNFSCICKFRLNNNISYCEGSFKISALPWAVGKITNGKWCLDKWSSDFKSFEDKVLNKILNSKDEWNYSVFEDINKYIVSLLEWDIPLSSIWIYVDERKINRKQKNKKMDKNIEEKGDLNTFQTYQEGETIQENLDEDDDNMESENEEYDLDEELEKKNELLNSFFTRDLEMLIEEVFRGNYGKGLKNFIEGNPWNKKIDIENDIDEIKRVMSPQNFPLGRWPSDYNLSLMQQVAVNLAKSEVIDDIGIFSVNGPPGTGKTTLLRDVIASIVVDRALELVKLENPDDAFVKGSKVKLPNFDGLSIYELKKDFRDFGIIVASNNNGAVKNITGELPGIEAIPHKYLKFEKYDYFSEQASYVFKKTTGNKCWAFISAILGNMHYCNKFADAFWDISDKTNKNKSMRIIMQDKELKKPSWTKAVKDFKDKLEQVVVEKEKLDKFEKNIFYKKKLETEIEESERNKLEIENNLQDLNKKIVKTRKLLDILNHQKSEIWRVIEIYKSKIKWWHRIFCFTKSAKKLFKDLEKEKNKYLDMYNKIKYLNSEVSEFEKTEKDLHNELKTVKIQIEEKRKQLNKAIIVLNDAKELIGVNFPDDEYWKNFSDNSQAQKNCPWAYQKFNELREELFLEALNLHKVFILNSNGMKNNLNLFYNLLKGRLSAEDEMKYTNDLLQSFFLLVPVISTTFASVSRFLRNIGREEIGWLLIDEAGQGTPQSAVGAIWRAKRTVIIGDPLQIEPVLTIHQRVMDRFKELYNLPEHFSQKERSVQSYGDQANPYGTKRGELWIGCPLRVHRRCINPMFNISNTIAYDGKMICATKEPKGIKFTIKKCGWESIGGKSNNPHYVTKQGRYIYSLLLKEFLKSKGELPSIFIITPFVTVKVELLKLFYGEDRFWNDLREKGVKLKRNKLNKWIHNSIGTVHTFQGKEAETVIFCLGVGSNMKNCGAIRWASSKPNILNVAATRAKYRLLIVGDSDLWKDKPYFKEAYKQLNTAIG